MLNWSTRCLADDDGPGMRADAAAFVPGKGYVETETAEAPVDVDMWTWKNSFH